ncbi:MAG: RimK family alpha-L-glutamate ligase [Promethearchaeota archaeon]
MLIGIILNRTTWEIKQLISEFEKRNIKYELLNNQKIYFKLSKEKDFDISGSFDIILERSLSFLRGLYSCAILEQKDYKVINNYECLNICGNKLLTTLKLIKNDIPTPKTCIAFKNESAFDAIEREIQYPAIIKPIIGSWGRLIAKVDDYNSAASNLECRETMGNILQKIYYIQKYIPMQKSKEDKPTDIRVFVVGDECVAAMGRFNPEKDFRSNIALGGTAKSIELTSNIKKLSLAATKAVNGEIVGVDLMENEGEMQVIEVNGTPQFQGIQTATGLNIAGEIVNYIENQYK